VISIASIFGNRKYTFNLYRIFGAEISIDRSQYIKIQPNTIDLCTRFWGINTSNSVVISLSLVLRSIVLGLFDNGGKK